MYPPKDDKFILGKFFVTQLVDGVEGDVGAA